ncbi:lysoplasmalogenase [Flavobacterium crassostreae]|uniref:Lysoplasmalogenase n=1 Tax=Flavobacterium crassostreae TaxID=1763534 RepID=A0A1B9E9J5_9FLAO|nr:lysoplasmalogenase [Flavobacterium crassostreae]OCB78637.1 hypothetical protein LPBF_01180 [Flavobacterium crassostreae]
MKTTPIMPFYLAFSSIYLLIVFLDLPLVAAVMKPILMPLLFAGVYFSGGFKSKKMLLAALFFSWIGDCLLLFADLEAYYFIFGLLAFLVSHLFYIVLFNQSIKQNPHKARYWIGITVIITYLLVFFAILFPNLGNLTLAVFVYALGIATMLLFAFKGFLTWPKPVNYYVLVGAVFFVCSDSMLGFNKFCNPIVSSSFLIMTTYLVAQYLIVIGILKLHAQK